MDGIIYALTGLGWAIGMTAITISVVTGLHRYVRWHERRRWRREARRFFKG